MFLKVWRLVAVLVFCVAGAAHGQRTFSVRGSVVDVTGASVPGASVRVEDRGGKVLGAAQSNSGGDFVVTGLRAGEVNVVVPEQFGLAARTMTLSLTANVTGLKVVLSPGSVNQVVTVNDDSQLTIDPAANKDSVAVSSAEMAKLPVFDQDYVAALTPFLDASSSGSGGVTLIVDGVEMKGVGVSASSIQEVKINNDPYSTEFSRPGRGRIEITTKPGSPQFHGEGNFIFRDAIFNAKNHFALVRPPEARRIFEGHLSGPVLHDGHTSFIASGSRKERDSAVVVNAVDVTGPINENVLTPSRNSQASLRVTHDFSKAHRLQVGYNFQSYNDVNAGVGGIVLPEAGYNRDSREDDLIFNDRIIVNPHLINQLMVTFEKDEDVARSVTDAAAVQVNGSITKGGAQNDSNRTENTIHVTEVVNWDRGRHYIRFGVQLPQFSKRAVDDHTNRLGTYGFASLANLASNTPYVFTAERGVGRGVYWANEVGAFVQDQIKVTPKLQMSLGVRYDWQTYVSDNNNLSPRVSMAYAPGKGKTILRAGSGIFYDRTGGDFPAIVKLHDGLVLQTIQLQNPSYPIAAGTNFTGVPSNIARFAAHIRSPYSVQSSVGMERQIRKVTLTAGYRSLVQVKSFRSRDVNAPVLPANSQLGVDYARPNAGLGQVQQIESAGRQVSNALDVAFRGSAGRWFSGQAQYTLSRSMGNTDGINWFPQNQYNPNAEWGRLKSDRRHAFNLLGNINPDHWLTLGVSATLYSGVPYNETTGTDDYHTGLSNARPKGVERNTLQESGTKDVDVFWNHDFNLTKARGEKAKVFSVGVSAFNVLNHTIYTGYIGSLSSTRFGQPTVALPGRQIQMGSTFRF